MAPSDSTADSTPPAPGVDPRVRRTRQDVLGAALGILTDQGWDAVTHAHLAAHAGYSRATIYKHWPTRTHLLRDALLQLADIPHHPPTGDLRADLIGEMRAFRDGMRDHGLDRAMAVLAEQARGPGEIAAVRDELVTGGDRVVRQLLATRLSGTELAVGTKMLSGAMFYSALMYGQIPDDDVIVTAVDILLRGTVAAEAG
ncbi:TetR/AcrR family transcriptional regulator [Kineosporia succinea]|uniref:AcrR family transcriptional regulator n=1 Tax=Kineosporia succinea TaxID=84632 RepID=A0ABT9PCE4_9ACTN|nr:TetR/AcrR family transcriptional regulator [Kineosporia succinea]MDP9830069.1 AcrR family transcriptional regulator [Kineosporia succinea]